MSEPPLDFVVFNHGSISEVTVLTHAAQGWVSDNVQIEDWQGSSDHFYGDYREIQDLAEAFTEAGFRGRAS